MGLYNKDSLIYTQDIEQLTIPSFSTDYCGRSQMNGNTAEIL